MRMPRCRPRQLLVSPAPVLATAVREVTDATSELHPREQVPHLHVDEATFPGEGLMLTGVRAANPRAGRVVAVLVGEGAFEHEDLLSAHVHVRLEFGAGLPAYEGDVLAAEPV